MFPRKCLWPESWMRNTPRAWGECLLSSPHVWFGLRAFAFPPFPHQCSQLTPLLGIRWPERNTRGLSVAFTKAARIEWGEWGHGHTPPALSRQTGLEMGEGPSPHCESLILFHHLPQSQQQKRGGLGWLMWPSTPVYNGMTLRETWNPAGNGVAFRVNLFSGGTDFQNPRPLTPGS